MSRRFSFCFPLRTAASLCLPTRTSLLQSVSSLLSAFVCLLSPFRFGFLLIPFAGGVVPPRSQTPNALLLSSPLLFLPRLSCSLLCLCLQPASTLGVCGWPRVRSHPASPQLGPAFFFRCASVARGPACVAGCEASSNGCLGTLQVDAVANVKHAVPAPAVPNPFAIPSAECNSAHPRCSARHPAEGHNPNCTLARVHVVAGSGTPTAPQRQQPPPAPAPAPPPRRQRAPQDHVTHTLQAWQQAKLVFRRPTLGPAPHEAAICVHLGPRLQHRCPRPKPAQADVALQHARVSPARQRRIQPAAT